MSRETYIKKITSDELIAKINPENKKIVSRFIRNFSTKRSARSVKVYESNFNIFFCWNLLHNDNKPFTEVRKIELMDFFDYGVEELKWSPNRYANIHSSLSSLSNFIENILDEEYPDFRNQVKKIEKVPKNTVRKKTIITDEQIDTLFNYLSKKDTREACFLALACYSGARVSELLRITADIIDVNNTAYEGLFIETLEEIKTKGQGKEGKNLYKYILKKPFVPYFNAWMEERSHILEKTGISTNALFIKDSGLPVGVAHVNRWIRDWERYLTYNDPNNPTHIPVNLYAHAFRHYLCTYLAKRGLEQELVVEIFGWSSSDMFKIYNDMKAKDRKWKGLEKLRKLIDE